MDYLKLNNSILIADYDYLPLIYRFKNEHPNLSIKVISKEDSISHVSFSYKEDPVPYLVKNERYDYSRAKKIARILTVCDLSKSNELSSLYYELEEKGFIVKDDLAEIEFKDKDIYLLEADEDRELHSLFKRNGYYINDIHLSDLDIQIKNDIDRHPPIIYFPNKFNQYFHLYQQLRKESFENSDDKERITVFVKDIADEYYIRQFSSIFKLPALLNVERSYLSIPKVKEKVNEIFKNKKFEFTDEEQNDRDIKPLVELVKKYSLDKLKFDFAYANLLELTNSLSFIESRETKGLTYTSNFTFDQSKIYYILDFQYDVFYKEFKDNSVLTDKELLRIDCNTSYDKTKLERRKKLNFIAYMNIRLLSRVTQHLSDAIYDSQFIEDFHWDKSERIAQGERTILDKQTSSSGNKEAEKITDTNAIKKVSMMDLGYFIDGYYTNDAVNLLKANSLDKQLPGGSYENINSYKHAYNGENLKLDTDDNRFSITDLEKYVNCPFQYLLNKLIPEKNPDMFKRMFGTMFHSILEKCYHKDFDLDTAIKDGVDEFRADAIKRGTPFTSKEEVYLNIAIHWIKEFIPTILSINKEMVWIENDEDYERRVTFEIKDKDGHAYVFNGSVDKILYTECGNTRFYTILDYKSGAEDFKAKECFLGKSIQLPLYYYALQSDEMQNRNPLLKGAEFAGFAIQHVYINSLSKMLMSGKKKIATDYSISEDTLKDNFKFSGPLLDDTDYKKSLCSSYTFTPTNRKTKKEDASTFVDKYNLVYVDKELAISISTGRKKDDVIYYPINDLIKDCIDSLLVTIARIKKGDFSIAPTSNDLSKNDIKNVACKFCTYKDVCYHNIMTDFVMNKEVVEAHFAKYKKGN